MAKTPTKKFAVEDLGKLVVVETKEKKELAVRQTEYSDIVEELRKFDIETDADFEYASVILQEIKTFAKEVDKRRKKVTDPLNAALKEFRSWYKPATKELEEGEKILKKKIGEYSLQKEKKREEQMRAIASAAKKGDFTAAHEASSNLVEIPTAKGISVSTQWDYTISDFAKIPREFLCVDNDEMKKYIKEAGASDPKDIPGITFKKISGVRAGSR